MAEALVSLTWLAAHLDAPNLALIDLRVPADGGRAAFEAGHIPGAVFSDYAADGWRQKIGVVPGLLPEPAQLAALFGRLGVTPESHVILIPAGTGANDLAASARALWTLKIVGHAAVSILDGGTRGWIAAGHAKETGTGTTPHAPPYPVVPQPGLRQHAESVLAALDSRSHALVDARATSYFAGKEKAAEAKRAGHIPGAISADYARLVDPETGALKPRAELAALLVGVPEGPVISYCNTGHTAALNWFVLSEVLGRPDITLYDGSMTDWTQDETRPVAVD
jgi:thiosulfate/3-mercaptopyruvate sulfurtransferase